MGTSGVWSFRLRRCGAQGVLRKEEASGSVRYSWLTQPLFLGTALALRPTPVGLDWFSVGEKRKKLFNSG